MVDSEQRLPLVCAAALKHTQVVELLLPATQRLEGVEWSVEGVVAHAQELLQAARAGQAGSSAPVEVSDEAREQAAAAKREGDKAFVAQQWKVGGRWAVPPGAGGGELEVDVSRLLACPLLCLLLCLLL
jgi:hypothetical protein